MKSPSAVRLDSIDDPSAEPRKSRGDWIDVAQDSLVEEGIDAVRITRLAEDLGVTRGSFYWHFKDRDELLTCLIERWERKNTAAVLNAVQQAQNLADGILKLFDIWIDPKLFDPASRLGLARLGTERT